MPNGTGFFLPILAMAERGKIFKALEKRQNNITTNMKKKLYPSSWPEELYRKNQTIAYRYDMFSYKCMKKNEGLYLRLYYKTIIKVMKNL